MWPVRCGSKLSHILPVYFSIAVQRMADSRIPERFADFLARIVQLQSFPFVILYLLMVFASSAWKKLVQPFELRMVMVVYNFFCSALSLYTLIRFVLAFLECGDLFDMTNRESLAHPFFIYWITKCIELLDTVFMILRHKGRQISFLHVYHHSSILLLSDISYHSFLWPPVGFIISMNSTVHIFLYFYYGQTAFSPGQRPVWKERLTQLQILQFLIGLIHLSIGYVYYGFCIYGIFYGLSMLLLFSNFYFWAFIHRKPTASEKKVS